MNELYKRITKVLIFVVSLQLFSIFMTQEFLISKVVEVPPYEPFGNATVTQAGMNAASLIVAVIATTVAFIVVIRIFGKLIIKYLFLIFSVFLVWIVNPIYISAIMKNHFQDASIFTILIANIALIATLVYATVKFNRKLLIASAFIVFAEVGSFMAQTFVPPTLFLVLFAFVVYDLFAVFYGPLKYFAEELGFPSKPTRRQMKKMERAKRELNLGIFIINIGDMAIGSGDFVFYSLAASSALILGGLLTSAMVIGSICVGFFVNAIILSKFRRMIPGLPIPILLALAVLLIS